MSATEQQVQFFKQIKSVIPGNMALVDDIADVLGISMDSAYRRIRGEKELTFSEIQKLCIHYRVSMDQLLHLDSEATLFHGRNLDTETFHLENYLEEIMGSLRSIKNATSKKIYYEAKDVPIFYHFQFPELAAFKYFFWMKSVMYYPEYHKMQFEDNQLTDVFHKTGKEIIKLYSRIPSAEIWVAETLNATLKQIEYYSYAGIFRKKATIIALYDQLTALVLHIQDQAETGKKFMANEKPNAASVDFELYYNEVFLGHNSIVVQTDGIQTAYINHAVMNFMLTRDPIFCNYTRRSLENNMKKSVLISTTGEKERNRFFNTLMANINKSREVVIL